MSSLQGTRNLFEVKKTRGGAFGRMMTVVILFLALLIRETDSFFTTTSRGRLVSPKVKSKSESFGGDHPLLSSRLVHAQLRTNNVSQAAAFWKARGAHILNENGIPSSRSTFIGFGMHRDTEHFALELSPTDDDTQIHNTALNFVGLSLLLPPSSLDEPQNGSVDSDPIARFLAQRATKPSVMMDPSNLFEVRSVASAPGDPFSRFVLRTKSKELLHRTAEFYCSVLHMSEVGMVSQDERCFRYRPRERGALIGVPCTLVFQVADTEDTPAAESCNSVECFAHLVICCSDVDATFAYVKDKFRGLPIILEPCNLFGTRIFGIKDPNGYEIYLVEELSFRQL